MVDVSEKRLHGQGLNRDGVGIILHAFQLILLLSYVFFSH